MRLLMSMRHLSRQALQRTLRFPAEDPTNSRVRIKGPRRKQLRRAHASVLPADSEALILLLYIHDRKVII